MTSAATARRTIWNGLMWSAFAVAAVLATSPIWNRLAFGFNPTLDQLLQIVCTSR